MSKIENKINEIMERYYHESDGCYSPGRYDSDGNEFNMDEEIKKYLDTTDIVYKIEKEDGFSSCGYDNEFLAVAWIENGELKLNTILLETF